MATVAPPLPPEPDFAALGTRLAAIIGEIIREPDFPRGDDLYAVALRRLLGNGSGFISLREHHHTVDSHTVVDKLNVYRAVARNHELWEENRRIQADGMRAAGRALRGWVNDVRVPSRLRREGVLIAADVLDPAEKKERVDG
jgi:hypothetical protein